MGGFLKILLIDIETAPILAHVWSIWQQNVGLNQIIKDGYVLSFAAEWYDDETSQVFYSLNTHSKTQMIKAARELLDKADMVIHYNGKTFDIPTLNGEMVDVGIGPPSPYKQLDLMVKVKDKFRWPSYKLQYVAQRLGVGKKVQHEGHELWIKVMNGDQDAWKKFEAYNRHDVTLLRLVYDKIVGWIDNHPNYNLYTACDDQHCVNCGSDELKKEGFAYTAVGRYQRFKCQACGKYGRDNKNLNKKKMLRGI